MDKAHHNSAYAKAAKSNTLQVAASTAQGEAHAVNQGAEDSSLKDAIASAPALSKRSESQVTDLFKQLKEDPKEHEDVVFSFIQKIDNSEEKDAICLLIMKNRKVDENVRFNVTEHIQSPAIQDQAHLYIAQDNTCHLVYRQCAALEIKSEALKDQACFAVVLDTKKPIDIFKLIEAITNPDTRDKACLTKVQNLISISNKIKVAALMINDDLRDTAFADIAKNSKATTKECLDVVKMIKSPLVADNIYIHILKFGKLGLQEARDVAQCIKSDELRDDTLIFILDHHRLLLGSRMGIIQRITHDDKRDERYASVVQDQSIRKTLLNRKIDAFNRIISSETVNALLSKLYPDDPLYSEFGFYEVLIRHGFIDCVKDTMNTSIEGLGPIEMEAVRAKKVAAAGAIFEMNQDDMDAAYILMSMSEDVENSPIVLYQTVQEKANAAVSLDDILKSKRDLVASLLEGKKVYFNSESFVLPRVMNPHWEKAFEDIDFASFMEQIKAVFSGYRKTLEASLKGASSGSSAAAIETAINENQILEKDYLSYFHSGERMTLQQALTDRREHAVTGNKMKAIAKSIQGCIDQDNVMEAMGVLSELKVNMATCKGGDQQAIGMTYMNRMLSQDVAKSQEEKSSDNAEANLRIAKEKVANIYYAIRLNWVLENHAIHRNGLKCVAYSPEKAGESFVEKILKRCPEATGFLKGHAFENTHDGLAVIGIVGKELGLRDANSKPTFDPNCEAARDLIQCKEMTKALLLEAFTDAFTFENTWESIAKELFESLASESKIEGYDLFKDEACTQRLDLSEHKDPLVKGATAFLKNIGFEMDEMNSLFATKEYYYKDLEYDDIYPTNMIIGFSKEGLGKILQKLGLLSVV